MRELAMLVPAVVSAISLAANLGPKFDLRARRHPDGTRSATVMVAGRESSLPDGSTAVRGMAATCDGRYVFVVHGLARYHLPVTQLDHGWVNTAAMSVFEGESGRLINTVLLDDPAKGAANPWGVAVNEKWIAVSHAGTHEVSLIDRAAFFAKLLPYKGDATSDLGFMGGIRRRIPLKGKGPRAIRFRDDGRIEVRLHYAEATAVIDPETGRVDEPDLSGGVSAAVAADPVRMGEMYFNDATLCYQGWQSCASCHVDGRDDGLTWDFPSSGGGLGHTEETVDLSRLARLAPQRVPNSFPVSHLFAVPDDVAKAVEAYILSLSRYGKRPMAEARPFKAEDYAALRKQLRAFYPPDGQGDKMTPQDPRARASYKRIEADLTAWCAGHPGYDALDVRRECYRAMRKHFVPYLFTESPFYFEAGVNGGWGGARPGRLVNRICGKFYKEQALIPDEEFRVKNARNREALALCCGPFVDDMHHVPPFRTILSKGFGGVRAEVAAALATCPKDDPHGRKQLETALVGLDTVHEIQRAFAKAADGILARTDLTDNQRRWMEMAAAAAKRCPWEPPKTFFEGLNTLWFTREILGYLDGTRQFSLGRPDAMLIDLYRADLAAGRLSAAEARDLVAHFLIFADCHYDCYKTLDSYSDHELEIPMSLGGCDKDGKPVWNELTAMFLDAHLGCDCVFPKLHCRVGSNSPEPYLRKIAEMLIKNHAVFTLLNDDRYVKQYRDEGFSAEDARSYIGVGCWNGFIDSVMDVDEANYTSVIRILELTIHKNPKLEKELRLTLEPLDGAKTFEEVEEITYRNFMRFFRDVLATYTRYGGVNAKVFPHPVYSACLRGGIESRRDTTEGGVASRPRVMTLGFIGNVVDSLCAIRQLCFVDRTCTLAELLEAVRANWAGPRGEELRLRALAAPYWGDGGKVATDMMARWMKRVRAEIDGFRNDQGGPYRIAIYAYREFMYWGLKTKATPDGRHSGDRLAQGFSPSEYRCKEGITAVMNSIGALPHEALYASNANLTFDRSAMNEALLAAIMRVFTKKGSHMMQPNCNSVAELLDAQAHPERHQDLIVRVCGFSARFVSLSKRWQDEVIARHRLK